MLVETGIPHRWIPTQIAYYGQSREQPGEAEPETIRGAGVDTICSVIANRYGSEDGLLEIASLLSPE